VLGLPDPVAACLFDLDGVLTQTARLHAAAWEEMFDDFLHRRPERTGEPFLPFRLPVDRVGQREALRREGADIVITGLADLLPGS
jgi:beta-phosphoglucomutase-like phosphatase (HAD superfamily)